MRALSLALALVLVGCHKQHGHENDPSSRDPDYRADQAYERELKKETTPVDESRKLYDGHDPSWGLRYLCIDGYVYVYAARGIAPYISNLSGFTSKVTKCEDFK